MHSGTNFLFKVALSLSALLAAALFAPQVKAANDGLFGTRELASANLAPFEKWTEVLERTSGSLPAGFEAFLQRVSGYDREAQIDAVNSYFNGAPYRPDYTNYGVGDYWATPTQLMARGGDCEDYAIAKYLALKALGVPADKMRIVVLKDLARGIEHAILVVYEEGRSLALDNNLAAVTETRELRSYVPLFSINEQAWWFHVA